MFGKIHQKSNKWEWETVESIANKMAFCTHTTGDSTSTYLESSQKITMR